MMSTVARGQLQWDRAAWVGIAVVVGVAVAVLPTLLAAAMLVSGALLLAVLIEPALALVVMLCIAPLKTLVATESPWTLPLDVGQSAMGLVVAVWLLRRVILRRDAVFPRTPLYFPLAVIVLGFIPSLFGAISVSSWMAEYLKWVEIALLIMIVVDLGQDDRWTWIAFGLLLAAGLQALIGLYEFRGGSGAPHLWIAGYHFFRAFGTFGQPNPFSAFMGLSLPLALGLAWGYGQHTWTMWWRGDPRARRKAGADWQIPAVVTVACAGCALLLLAGLVASWGRGAWLGFGAAGTVMVFFAPRRRWQGVIILVGGGMLMLALWTTGFVPLSIQQRIDNALTEFTGFGDMRGVPISDENFAIVERLAHWQAAYNMANAHPYFGVGLGNYEAAYPDFGLPSWPRALGHAHNDYLNLLAETGMLGLTGYLAGWLIIVAWTLRALRQPDVLKHGLALGLLGTWTHLAVHSVVDKLYVNNLFLHIGVMLGLLAIACNHEKSSAGPST